MSDSPFLAAMLHLFNVVSGVFFLYHAVKWIADYAEAADTFDPSEYCVPESTGTPRPYCPESDPQHANIGPGRPVEESEGEVQG